MTNLTVNILLLLIVAYSVSMVFMSLGRMSIRKLIGLNNSDVARHYFLLLLAQAQRKVVIYCDGERHTDSYYWDEEVLNAIERKLREHPEITLQCLFNHPVPNPLSSKFEGEHQVDLRSTGLEDSAPRDVRMIVIDDGRMTYSTRYNPAYKAWQFELVDCLTVMRWALKRVVKGEFGDSIGLLEQKFSEASET